MNVQQMSAAELLGWFEQYPHVSLELVQRLIRLGLDDIDAIAAIAPSDVDSVKDWAETIEDDLGVAAADVRITADEVPMLAALGPTVFVKDRRRVAEWMAVVREIEDTDSDLYFLEHASDSVDVLIDAGRTPEYAREIIAVAIEANVEPDEFGFGPDVTPEAFRTLTAAGIKTSDDWEEFFASGRTVEDLLAVTEVAGELGGFSPARYGLSSEITPDTLREIVSAGFVGKGDLDLFVDALGDVPSAIALRAAGVHPNVLAAAIPAGVPQRDWMTLLPGIPGGWFRDVTGRTHGIRTATADGFDFEQIKFLADHGWADDTLDDVLEAANKDAEVARMIADAGITASDYLGWHKALRNGASRPSEPPELVVFDRTSTAREQTRLILDAIARLSATGVRRSALSEYRFSGCRSIEDVTKAAASGVTADIAKRLRESEGDARGYGRVRRRFSSVDKLLEAAQRAAAPSVP